MSSPSPLRARLALLQGDCAAPAVPKGASQVAPLVSWRELFARNARGRESPSPRSHAPASSLERGEALPGRWVEGEEGLVRVFEEVRAPGACVGKRSLVGLADTSLRAGWELLVRRAGASPPIHAPLVLDFETTGLGFGGGTRAWLAGLAWEQDGAWRMEQRLITGPGAERCLIEAVRDRMAACDGIVSFNGRSFDVPLFETRAVLHRVALALPDCHVDLLPVARRLWRRPGEDSRLISLERDVLGVARHDDLPSSEVPAAWLSWIAGGDDTELRAACEHNAADVWSLVALLEAAASALAGPEASGADLVTVAEWRCTAGDPEGARAALSRQSSSCVGDAQGLRRRARVERRLDGRASAESTWLALVARSDSRAEDWENLAKILEHDSREFAAALDVVERALARFGADLDAREGLSRRKVRLQRRMQRSLGLPLAGRLSIPCEADAIAGRMPRGDPDSRSFPAPPGRGG